MMKNSYQSEPSTRLRYNTAKHELGIRVFSYQFWHNLWQVCFRLPLQGLLLKTVNRRLITLMLPLFLIITLSMLANWCFPLPKARLHPPVSQIVLDRNGEWLRAFLADDSMWRFSRQLSVISYQSQEVFDKPDTSLTENSYREAKQQPTTISYTKRC